MGDAAGQLVRPPLILGLVLGPLAEKRLFLSTGNYGLAWLWRPGVLLLIALTLAGALYPVIRAERKKRRSREAGAARRAMSSSGAGLKVGWANLFTLFVVATFIAALWHSMRFNFKTGLFPWVVGFAVLALAVAQLILEVTGKRSEPGYDHQRGSGSDVPRKVVNRRTLAAFGWIVGFCAMIWLFGFSIGGPLCTFIQLKFGGREKWLLSLVLTALAWVLIYGLFDSVLHIPFPAGLFFQWMESFSV